MAIKIITGPAEEPVTLTEAKLHAKVDLDQTDDDGLLTGHITAARVLIEKEYRRQLITATWEQSLDAFPCADPIIRVPVPPLQSVTSITYIDIDGVLQTLSASLYRVDAVSTPGRITPAYGESWPSTRELTNAVTIRFVAGYGLAAAVLATTKIAIKQMVADWHANRERPDEIPRGVRRLLMAEHWGSYP